MPPELLAKWDHGSRIGRVEVGVKPPSRIGVGPLPGGDPFSQSSYRETATGNVSLALTGPSEGSPEGPVAAKKGRGS